ncbi:transcriptional regulator, XRE family (plasmid) [Allomeiothermus silvanus DSM 9946]|uniref:Transcriptional regulator, XRE family n=1 Tax=Allomeiothermus silvanus (strain ATCC 700542 / DSM 9946 / NBRC 106475 / NCIMB 13440 / VI-R2) TaxID=526227 RepID=D7BJK4_ALLS1|nr:helix-turn-helix transcriptional regulator [Allomeiothermus silvanus]ADH65360.1 transcriptional regulator, XRE family [Allomeiothermus silvanus DSM 9946]
MAKKSFRTASQPSENIAPDWARLLLARREKLGLSREALALAAGVSASLIAKLERGTHDIRDMSVGRLQALLRALHLPSLDLLLGGSEGGDFPSTPGLTPLPYYPALAPACGGEEAPGRSHLDTRLLPTRPGYAGFFLATLEGDALCSEDLPLAEGSLLVVERKPARERGMVLLGLVVASPLGEHLVASPLGEHLEETRRPLLYRLPPAPRLVRPVGGVGTVYWLLPDGSLQLPAGKKTPIYPLAVGVVHGEFRLI